MQRMEWILYGNSPLRFKTAPVSLSTGESQNVPLEIIPYFSILFWISSGHLSQLRANIVFEISVKTGTYYNT